MNRTMQGQNIVGTEHCYFNVGTEQCSVPTLK